MKGISTIIATLLLLIITIALAGVAFTYISGVITGRTAVVLSLDASNQQCIGANIIPAVTNDGTTTITGVTVTARYSNGTTVGTCTVPTVNGGSAVAQCSGPIIRPSPTTPGTYALQAVAGADIATATVYCST